MKKTLPAKAPRAVADSDGRAQRRIGRSIAALAPAGVMLSLLPPFNRYGAAVPVLIYAVAAIVLAGRQSLKTIRSTSIPVAFAGYTAALSATAIASPVDGQWLEIAQRAIVPALGLLVGVGITRRQLTEDALLYMRNGSVAVVALAVFIVRVQMLPSALATNLPGVVALFGFIAIIGLQRASEGEHSTRKVLFLASALFAGTVALEARTAMVLFVAIAGLWGLRQRRFAPYVALASPFALLGTFLVSAQLNSESQVLGTESAAQSRQAFRDQAWTDWFDAPIFGNGLLYFRQPGSTFPRPSGVYDQSSAGVSPHNSLLEALAESGVVGLILLLLVLLVVSRSLRGRTWRLPAQLAGFAVVASSLVDVLWESRILLLLFTFVGFAVVPKRLNDRRRIDGLDENNTVVLGKNGNQTQQ